jgi:hypothetical protein
MISNYSHLWLRALLLAIPRERRAPTSGLVPQSVLQSMGCGVVGCYYIHASFEHIIKVWSAESELCHTSAFRAHLISMLFDSRKPTPIWLVVWGVYLWRSGSYLFCKNSFFILSGLGWWLESRTFPAFLSNMVSISINCLSFGSAELYVIREQKA